MKRTTQLLTPIVCAVAALFLAATAFTSSAAAVEEGALLKLAASKVEITTFYNGTTLTATGTIPADEDVVLEVSGPKKDVHLKEKGKVAGFLWMNKNDVSLENTPAVYMVYTPTGPVDKYVNQQLGIGYAALVDNIAIEPEEADKAFIFGEYVKLMEKAGVYAINQGTISYGAPANGMKTFTVTLTIPSLMAAGDYTVHALTIKDGAVTNQASEKLTLILTGFPKTIADLAYGKPLLFGIMAVVIAVATGLFIGAIFKGGGGAH